MRTEDKDIIISEENLLNFHLSYLTNPNFEFNPKSKNIKIDMEIFIFI